MSFAALIATMVALASPNAHGLIKIDCTPMTTGIGGLAYPWDERVELGTTVCKFNFRIILHRHATPIQAVYGTMDLLHEAAHVGQWRESPSILADSSRAYEHDAECRALTALPLALYTLQYRKSFVRGSVELAKEKILAEPAPYGGTC